MWAKSATRRGAVRQTGARRRTSIVAALLTVLVGAAVTPARANVPPPSPPPTTLAHCTIVPSQPGGTPLADWARDAWGADLTANNCVYQGSIITSPHGSGAT